MQKRRTGGVVVTKDRRQPVRDRRAHAVEARETAVAVAEEAQCRQHAVDRPHQGRGWGFGLVGIGLAQRQEVGQKFEQHHRVARDVPAVRQDLPVELGREVPRRVAHDRTRHRQRQRREGQSDAGAQQVLAVGHVARGKPQVAHLRGKRFEVGAIERKFRALQHDRRVLQPGDDANSGDGRIPRGRGDAAAMDGDPVGDQRPRVGKGEFRAGLAHVAQPAEAMQGMLPLERSAGHLEGRSAAGFDQLSGERIAAVVDIVGDLRVGQAKVGRRDEDALGRPAGETPAIGRPGGQPAPEAPPVRASLVSP